MQRRPLLTAIATLSTAGCLDRSSSGPSQDEVPSSDANEGAYAGLEIVSVYPCEVDREFIDYEYVELKNTAESAVSLDGVTVEYTDATSYELSENEVRAGSRVVITSRARTEVTLATGPAVYIRSAGFGQTKDTSVLTGEGTVLLKSPDGTLLDTEQYDTDSCE